MTIEVPQYTLIDMGTTTLAGTTYRVEAQVSVASGKVVTTWLYGPRGGIFFLRQYLLRSDDGVRQVISWDSGQPLRKDGNEVRAVILGNVVEEHKPAPSGAGSIR